MRVRPLPSGPLLSARFPAAHASPSHCSAGPTCHLPPLALPQRPSVIPAANLATAFQTRTPKSPAPPFKPSPQPPAPTISPCHSRPNPSTSPPPCSAAQRLCPLPRLVTDGGPQAEVVPGASRQHAHGPLRRIIGPGGALQRPVHERNVDPAAGQRRRHPYTAAPLDLEPR